ncbi:3306_t:CDS:2 [Funneliformis caledonium]|uniref:3306_t:CDS:1 n=1 Tax=Funneliformis caledonium TaxID=1117310 RepID=A0A9N9G3D1_9GLOM|nr:3306_t:CDS:2 [Funneliformis caledonium]
MTNFSDFSFLARAIADFCILIWSIIHIYSIDKFEALRWKVIKRKEVKSIMTILYLISIVLILTYDVISSKIKYSEGFIFDPTKQRVIDKPQEQWSPENKQLRRMAHLILMIFYAVENSAIFLLQNFWNYLVNDIVRAKFITTWQFRINYAFIAIALIIFPCIHFLFSIDDQKMDSFNVQELKAYQQKQAIEEVIPQLAAMSCNLFVLVYGLMAHLKFSSLIKHNNRNHIADRLKYYRYMNGLLILIIGLGASSMIIFNVDALTEKKYLNNNKFTIDLFAGIINISMVACWIVWLLIFYPRLLPNDGGYLKLSSPSAPLKSQGSKNVKHIQIKIDSTTIIMDTNQENYVGEGISGNPRGSIVSEVLLPPPLATNNKQIVSYARAAKGTRMRNLTNIPLHKRLMENPTLNTEELFQTFHGPDFPGCGIVLEKENLLNFYEKGKGTIYIRGRPKLERETETIDKYENF